MIESSYRVYMIKWEGLILFIGKRYFKVEI